MDSFLDYVTTFNLGIPPLPYSSHKKGFGLFFLSNILARRQWSQLFSGLRYAAQGRQEEERCRKVGQERQRSSEQMWGQGQKEEAVQRQSSGQAQ